MSKIRSKNTGIEKIIFRELRKRKIYFQRYYSKAIGNLDIALPKKKKAVFIELGGVLVIGKEANYQPIFIDNIDFVHDLAVLRFKRNAQTPQAMFNQMIKQEFDDGLFLSENDPVVSNGIMYAGYPLENILLNAKHDPSYSEGVISMCDRKNEFGRKEFQISGSIVGGYSGSPITLKSDPQKIVGIVSNSPSKAAGDAGIFMAVSYKHIKALAELSNS